MSEFGLTPTGFRTLRQADIIVLLKEFLRDALGQELTFDPTSPETGQINAMAERFTELFEEIERVNNAQDPDKAEGAALDKIGAFNLIARLPETKSLVVMRIIGDEDTEVAAGDFEASVSNNPDARFVTTEDALLETPYNSKQTISFSDVPINGDMSLTFDGQQTASLDFEIDNEDLEDALEALSNIGPGEVQVTGDFATGFIVEFLGAMAAAPQEPILVALNTYTDDLANEVDITITQTQIGGFGDDVEAEALEFGPLAAPAGTLTAIETPTSGVDAVTNPAAADVGTNIETDSAYRIRRANSLQKAGTATLEGIRNLVAEVSDVDTVLVFENAGDVVDGEGRPPHSIEVVVLGGADADIALAIWQAKAGGIQTFGSESEDVVDSQGTTRTILFNRPTEVPIYMTVEIVPNTDPNESEVYPDDGDDLVEAAILAFALENQPIGRDVIVNKYFIPVNSVPGVNGIVIKVGLSASPTLSANLILTSRQLAVFAAARIVIDSTP